MKVKTLSKKEVTKTAQYIVALLITGVFFAACGGGGGGTSAANDPGLTAEDQSLELTQQIEILSADVPSDAWLVVYEDNGGTPSATTVAVKGLAPASYSDLKVGLDRPAASGELFHVILHEDLGAMGTWEPGIDTPFLDGMSNAVADSLVVTVSAGTPDVRLTVTNVGTSDFRWTMVEPDSVTGVVTVGANDPALTLTLDVRYEIVNLATAAHPFELISAATTLLSEQVAGNLEADAGIGWTDDGSGTIRFTATATLDASLSAYRCFIHPGTMTGSASIM